METIPALTDTAYELAAGYLHTRLLYPFSLQRRCCEPAVEALEHLRCQQNRPVWQCADPHAYYRRDILDNVQHFLFARETHGGCRYLKVDDTTLHAWFHNWLLIRCPQHESFTAHVSGGPGIELFISPYGVGVLSITLQVGDKLLADGHPYTRVPLDPGDAQQFNYQVAQMRPATRPSLLLPHPNAYPFKPPPTGPMAATIPPAPTAEAPFTERLGVLGGEISLDELQTFLLSPLETAGGKEVLRIHHNDSVWSVAISPDGRFLATASLDNLAQLVEIASGQEVARIQHSGEVHSVTFSPDNRLLATASEDNTAQLVETASGKEVARIEHGDRV